MKLRYVERGAKVMNNKQYTWAEKVHVYCNSCCCEHKTFDLTGHTKSKNLVITCSQCGDSLTVPQSEIADRAQPYNYYDPLNLLT